MDPLYIAQSFEVCGFTSQFNLHSTLNHILRSNTLINDFIDDLQEADEMDGFDNDVDESPVASNDEPTVASAEPSVEMIDEHSVARAIDFVQPQMSSLSLANSMRVISPESVSREKSTSSSLQLTCIHTPSPLFIDKPQSSSQLNLAHISQTPNISQCISSAQIPLD
ncbi:hypothetical protein BpHYR1_039079 [Brachionus plicatilis]|uniref:Uncharacterized protein n=1 Tax=Brachionus plicatilis TaxID=10195 RepID=A0A3M7RZH2_BRAPC|nr:hypothetical protein BpHYR1_039079 [Brachionus plicatilis]